jgi:hypothetical protein
MGVMSAYKTAGGAHSGSVNGMIAGTLTGVVAAAKTTTGFVEVGTFWEPAAPMGQEYGTRCRAFGIRIISIPIRHSMGAAA